MRLGLVIAEIGEKNNIKVTDEQLTAAVVEQARQFPGQEQQIWDYYRKNPRRSPRLRAPLFEDKVVDFLIELADVTDKRSRGKSCSRKTKSKRACGGQGRRLVAGEFRT